MYGASSGDSLVGEEVEKAKKKEGDEGHHKKVGKEDVVWDINGVVPVCTLPHLVMVQQRRKLRRLIRRKGMRPITRKFARRI